MKILHILAQLPEATGSGVYFKNLIDHLAPYGHEQRAVFAVQDGCVLTSLPPPNQYPVTFKTPAIPFPVPGMSDVMPYDSTPYSRLGDQKLAQWTAAFEGALRRAKGEFQPDILIIHHLWLLAALALEIFPEPRSIAICHHTDLRQARQNPRLAARVKGLDRLSAILSLSDFHQGEILQQHQCCQGRKLITMGGGYDEKLFFPRLGPRADGPVRLLYAGKIDPSKGVLALYEAYSQLKKTEPDLSLTIIGAPPAMKAGHLASFWPDPSISLRPPLPQTKLAAAMRAHDVFILPSFFEGLGLIAVEALASGLWTVASRIEGLAALLGPLVPQSGAVEFVPLPPMEYAAPPQGAALEKFIRDLMAKIALQTARVRRGEKFPPIQGEIAKHSWAAIAARVNELMEQLRKS